MTSIALKIALGLVAKLMTETFMAKALVYALRDFAARTEKFKLDDQIVEALAEALSVK